MTTKVRITHDGGDHPIDVFIEGVQATTLEKEGDSFTTAVFSGRKVIVRECQHANTPAVPSHDPEVPAENSPKG